MMMARTKEISDVEGNTFTTMACPPEGHRTCTVCACSERRADGQSQTTPVSWYTHGSSFSTGHRQLYSDEITPHHHSGPGGLFDRLARLSLSLACLTTHFSWRRSTLSDCSTTRPHHAPD